MQIVNRGFTLVWEGCSKGMESGDGISRIDCLSTIGMRRAIPKFHSYRSGHRLGLVGKAGGEMEVGNK